MIAIIKIVKTPWDRIPGVKKIVFSKIEGSLVESEKKKGNGEKNKYK